MRAVLLNGSPRKGNTCAALHALKTGFVLIDGLEVVEINASKLQISPCIACGACEKREGCVLDDQTNEVMEEILRADVLVFALPVYWWGIPAQLKLIIDKFYSRMERFAQVKKLVGVLMVGQLSTDNIQYELIHQQIACISDYLGWEVIFSKAYSAYDPEDLAADQGAIQEIKTLWQGTADALSNSMIPPKPLP